MAGLHLQSPHVEDFARIEAIALGLADAVDAKGQYAPSHSHAVARTAQVIGHALDFPDPALQRLRIAGLCHDVGKLYLPDAILLKPARLTPAEYETVKRHPVLGHELLLNMGLPDEARWVLHHHERADGHGYPSGLRGSAIPLGARILLIADAYDVMVNRTLYDQPKTPTHAVRELRASAGKQFDRHLVEVLATILDQGGQLADSLAQRPVA